MRRARADLADAKSAWSDSCLDPAGTCPDTEAWSQLRSAEADVTSAKSAYDQAVQTASATETTNNIKLNQAQMDVSYAKADQDAACNTYGSSSNQCTSAVSSTRNAQQQYELQANANQTAARAVAAEPCQCGHEDHAGEHRPEEAAERARHPGSRRHRGRPGCRRVGRSRPGEGPGVLGAVRHPGEGDARRSAVILADSHDARSGAPPRVRRPSTWRRPASYQPARP